MYRDKPKSPSFTQSAVDTNTFRAAMSLRSVEQQWEEIQNTSTFILFIYMTRHFLPVAS